MRKKGVLVDVKQASVYKFTKKGDYLIHSVSRTKGPSIATPPYIWLKGNVSLVDVVEQVFVALQSSQNGVPLPTDWEEATKDFLNSAGLEKESAFYKDCIHVSVSLKEGSLTFSPMSNIGRKGFLNIVPYQKVEVPITAGAKEIASALSEALELCE
ncbi:hypothetical protein SAMN05421788_101538 [Filimonas lacunae]|uniref:Uncharacterized protein n=1 Tax=Filimonas lacunae TaxID=477680 RepID=A0A1N7L024_9BACT|nr:hypothetical protein [Filimonas lacunae]SIS67171.1 hypothetical protein SAMN05421788_101538 [Filimonas lacunae]